MRKQENKNSTKEAIKKTRKQELGHQESDHFLGRVLVFLFSYFLVFFYQFWPQVHARHLLAPFDDSMMAKCKESSQNDQNEDIIDQPADR